MLILLDSLLQEKKMNLSRICVRSRLKSMVLHQGIRERSTACPSYSSSGDLSRAVTKLGLPRISTMIMVGKPNSPFPDELGVEVESMSEGGKQAAEVVTGFLTEGDYGGLEGLLSSECINGLVSNLQGFSAEEKKYLLVKADDVFFSFIPELKPDSDGGGQSLTLVLFSFPGLGEMKEIISSNRQQMDDVFFSFIPELKDNKVDGGAIKESINQTLQDAKERIETNDPHLNFRDNEILISNLVFHRSNLNSDR